ncbi:hypothetical protein [Shewanella algae]|uniref:hypothetical protein n=1 Tax=Shewanella algae TaxID=38313 RepID=UPI0011846A0C|nr:hypothetical protein [Shewanella algae]TVL47439.1 hypothetical protein AYI99_11110 [Shewanella algae]
MSKISSHPFANSFFDKKLIQQAINRTKSARLVSAVSGIEKFREQYQYIKHTSGKNDLLCAMLGVSRITHIEVKKLPVDERLCWGDVLKRRREQAKNLQLFIEKNSHELGYEVPVDLAEQCDIYVKLVQPTAIAYDKYLQAYFEVEEAKLRGELPLIFESLWTKVIDNPEVTQSDAYKVIALHRLADEYSITPDIFFSNRWLIIREELGIIAARWINSGTPVKSWQGIGLLQALWDMGIIYAGCQLAQSLFHKAGDFRRDEATALKVIIKTFAQYKDTRQYGPVFTEKNTENELFRCYNTIVLKGLQDEGDPKKSYQLTQSLVNVLTEGAEKRFEGFAAALLCIVTPEFQPLSEHSDGIDLHANKVYFSLRDKLSRHEKIESFLRDLAKSNNIKKFQSRFK